MDNFHFKGENIFASPYTFSNNNPVIVVDPDGNDGVLVVDKVNGILTIKAHYFVELNRNGNGAGFSKIDYLFFDQLDTDLNLRGYKVTDKNSEYYGYDVRFDFTTDVINNSSDDPATENKIRAHAEGQGLKSTGGEPSYKGFPISNSVVAIPDKIFESLPDVIAEAKARGASVSQMGGITSSDDQHILFKASKTASQLTGIHEIFHTLYFNRDGATEDGIGKGNRMPTDDEINELIKGFENNGRVIIEQ